MLSCDIQPQTTTLDISWVFNTPLTITVYFSFCYIIISINIRVAQKLSISKAVQVFGVCFLHQYKTLYFILKPVGLINE